MNKIINEGEKCTSSTGKGIDFRWFFSRFLFLFSQIKLKRIQYTTTIHSVKVDRSAEEMHSVCK